MLRRQIAAQDLHHAEELEEHGVEFFDGTSEQEREMAKASLIRSGLSEGEVTEKRIAELINSGLWCRLPGLPAVQH